MTQLSPQAQQLVNKARIGDEPVQSILDHIELQLTRRVAGDMTIAANVAGTAVETMQTGSVALSGKVIAIAIVAAAVVSSTLFAVGRQQYRQRSIEEKSASAVTVSNSVLSRSLEETVSVPPVAASASRDPQPEVTPTIRVLHKQRVAASAPSSAPPAMMPPTSTDEQLKAETRALRNAQQALRAGNAQHVLLMLDEQDSAFNNGILQEERAAARILALCGNGQTALARSESERFERRWPSSSHLARLRTSCIGQQ